MLDCNVEIQSIKTNTYIIEYDVNENILSNGKENIRSNIRTIEYNIDKTLLEK